MKFLKKHWGNLLVLAFIIILIVPATRLPVQVFVHRSLSFAPSVLDKSLLLEDYDWRLETSSGKNIDFSSAKGKVVLVNFWATWCAPCIAEMPSFQGLYDDYKKRVDFYFVSFDNKENVKNFMRENHYSFPVYFPLEAEPNALIGQSLPSTFLIDQHGNILIKEFGTADWNSEKMRQILNGLLKE